ncbi:MAG: LysM peptidoglycan-binding domain-containing protein [Pseudomonadales bacterium]|uniref:LysM domain-containing protein n=1 Tax=Oleiphilus messinensis TaxID=141451 RepID=A0A1Y0I3P6_9GAMM|nr:LysM peptidoglycan-binding domain-containing protein [Oleiphilus messinensis]ARU54145.1 LysM domain-containing protein [Oleiphilus messinensis]MCG8613165.1 LysM peptidoglycan-binding domain-containing protein [Pseudomonadales bacterium]
MRKLLHVVAALMISVSTAWAQPDLKANHPETYTVVKGDTLWDISSRFLDSPWLWPEIWHANPQVDNPHLIYPGDVLGLIYVEGKPKLTMISRGEASRTVKLTPKARITPLDTAIPAIPLDAISSFLTGTRIVEPADLNTAPYVLIGKDGHLVTGAGDTVYARGDLSEGQSVGIFREGKRYVDPDTSEFLGLEAREIGMARVEAVNGEVVTLKVQRTREEILQGDRILPTDDRIITSTYHPSSPKADITGRMISVLNGVRNIGQYDVVVIDKGSRDGVEEGNVFAVYRKGGLVRDPITTERIELPSERAGVFMVFRIFEKVSYGLVLRATLPLAIGDEVRKP